MIKLSPRLKQRIKKYRKDHRHDIPTGTKKAPTLWQLAKRYPANTNPEVSTVSQKDKFFTFIKLCKSDLVHSTHLFEKFEDFMASDFSDALEYFTSKGMVYEIVKPISDVEICKKFVNYILNYKQTNFKLLVEEMENSKDGEIAYIIGQILKSYNGSLDPRRVATIFKELKND